MQKIGYWAKRAAVFVVSLLIISALSTAIVAVPVSLMSEDVFQAYFEVSKKEFLENCDGIFCSAFIIAYLCKSKIVNKFYLVAIYLLVSVVLFLLSMI